jgi:phosphatidylglycerol---prolipoprotein diacylglyceryl transferase
VHPTLLALELPVLGTVELPAYMTLLMVGFTLAIWLARREEDRGGRDGDRVVDLGLWMVLCGLLGARALSVLADGQLLDFVHLCTDPGRVAPVDAWARAVVCSSDATCAPHYVCDVARGACHPPRDCLAALKFWNGGLAYYGGFLVAAPVGLWYLRRKQLGVWRVADLVSPFIALGLFFGRMGCFFTGCCFGEASALPWAIRFPGHRAPVHPTQLYEALGALAIAAFLYLGVRPRKRAHGQVFAALLLSYALLRFILEFWRADERGELLGLSTSQWIGLPLAGVGAWLIWRKGCVSARRA